jgi:DNA-directed RNA polymerase alpha subunit
MNCLWRADIKTIDALRSAPACRLRRIGGIGKKRLREIEIALRAFDERVHANKFKYAIRNDNI